MLAAAHHDEGRGESVQSQAGGQCRGQRLKQAFPQVCALDLNSRVVTPALVGLHGRLSLPHACKSQYAKTGTQAQGRRAARLPHPHQPQSSVRGARCHRPGRVDTSVLGVPVKFASVGETAEDLQSLNAELFTEALFLIVVKAEA